MRLRLKRKFKIALYLIFILIIGICMIGVFKYGKNNVRLRSITYSRDSDVNYVTYLKNNNHYSDQYLEDDYNYVASLIDYFNIDFNYSYVLSEKIKYDLSYEVIADLEVYDADNKSKPIEKKKFQVLDKKTESNTGQLIKVDLYNQIINYDTYNTIIQEWKKEVKPDATLKVSFVVNWKGYSTTLEKELTENYVKEFYIPISEKIITISKPARDTDAGKLYADQAVGKWFTILMASFGLLLLVFIVGLINTIIKGNKNKSKYEQRISKILREFDRAITEAKGDFKRMPDEHYIEVNDFMELLDAHDNLNEPIIYYKNHKNTRSTFVVRNGTDIYYAVIKRDEYD